jgi:hypothetical protein
VEEREAIMLPERDIFHNENVGLEVHHFGDQTRTYWLKSHMAFMELDENDFKDLLELLEAYQSEEILMHHLKTIPPLIKYMATAILLTLFVGLVLVYG